MKKVIHVLAIAFLLFSCKEKTEQKTATETEKPGSQVVLVAAFKGQQVTGTTVTDEGRIFVNFPRWRQGVENSVLEVKPGNQFKSYPDEAWNSWEVGDPVAENKFVGVQSVVAFEQQLYVLDTRNALFQGVIDVPRLYVFDLPSDQLSRTYLLDSGSYHPNSYINDLRIDKKNGKIYLTDSGKPGLVIIDMESGKSRRILDGHPSTTSEQDYLTFGETKWNFTVHSDGIALDVPNEKLYYHALTGYNLYSIGTGALQNTDTAQIAKSVTFEGKTAAPDGMIFDKNGNLYFADLENNKIMYRTPDGSTHTLVEGSKVKWADTFSIYEGYLYFTNSRINEAGPDISSMSFTLNKVKLPR